MMNLVQLDSRGWRSGGPPADAPQAAEERLLGVQEKPGPAGRKVLILALSGIGNFLMQSPTIEALKKAHPNWHITAWVAPRGTRTLAKRNSHIDAVLEEPHQRSLLKHLKLIWRLRQEHFDIGLVLSPGQLIKSATYLWLAGIPKRIGHKYPFLGRQTGFLLTDSISENPPLHDLEQNMQLLELLPRDRPWPILRGYSLTIPLSAQKRADDLLHKLPNTIGKKLIGFHPGSAPNFLWKRWPLQHWAELGQALVEKNYHILIFGGTDEAKLKRKLHARLNKDATITETDLFTTAAIMQKCEFFISNDSGLMHLAAAAGVKTFGLFGPTDERQTGPRGKDSHVIRAPSTQPAYHTEKNFNLGSKPHETMRALQPHYVLESIFA